jgi:hypothetical protein
MRIPTIIEAWGNVHEIYSLLTWVIGRKVTLVTILSLALRASDFVTQGWVRHTILLIHLEGGTFSRAQFVLYAVNGGFPDVLVAAGFVEFVR